MAGNEKQLDDIASRIADGVAAGIQRNSPQKVTAGRYDGKSSFHPVKAKAVKLRTGLEVYQNGTRLNPALLHDNEIEMLNQITRPGRYVSRLVEVMIKTTGSGQQLNLSYNNKKIDQRMTLKGHFRDLREMLTKILAEQTAHLEGEKATA